MNSCAGRGTHMFDWKPRTYLMVKTAALSTLMTIAVASPIAYKFYVNQPPRLAVVDLQGLLREQEAAFSKSLTANMSDSERRKLADSVEGYGKQLSDSVVRLGQQCSCVLLNKAAVLGNENLDDLTPQLREMSRK